MNAPKSLRYQGQLYVRAQLNSPAEWFADLVKACRGTPFKAYGNERKAVVGQFGSAAVHVALLSDFVVVDLAFGRVYHMWQNRTHVAEDGMVEASGGWSAELGDTPSTEWDLSGIHGGGRTSAGSAKITVTTGQELLGHMVSWKTKLKRYSAPGDFGNLMEQQDAQRGW